LLGASTMLDVIVLAIGLAFFALSVGYTIACDRL
jgi:SNF family Na+-dependent transporter